MGRLAALFVLLSQLLLLEVVLLPSGPSSIWFMFVGHPLVFAGVALGVWTLTRRLLREAHEREAAEHREP